MTADSVIDISKLDAAKRQLEFSIKTFFYHGDFVVIHTLVSAAKTILGDLANRRGITSFTDEMMKTIRKDKQKEVRAKLNEAQNFFKHADTDPEKLLKFNPELSEYSIWESIELYQKITLEVTSSMKAFRMFFYTKYSSFLLNPEAKEGFIEAKKIIGYEDRSQFIEIISLLERNQLL